MDFVDCRITENLTSHQNYATAGRKNIENQSLYRNVKIQVHLSVGKL